MAGRFTSFARGKFYHNASLNAATDAAAFREKHGRPPTLWLDKICIDQVPRQRVVTSIQVSHLSGTAR